MTIELATQAVGEMSELGYEKLADVLARAYAQAATGKGRERHANDKPFHVQPMQDLIRLHGVGFATGQASKKASEALGLPTVERQVAELLGAIVYLSGAVIALERTASDSKPALKEGWVEWGGGRQPVHADTLVMFRMRQGGSLSTARAGSLFWHHTGKKESTEIIAYCVIEDAS